MCYRKSVACSEQRRSAGSFHRTVSKRWGKKVAGKFKGGKKIIRSSGGRDQARCSVACLKKKKREKVGGGGGGLVERLSSAPRGGGGGREGGGDSLLEEPLWPRLIFKHWHKKRLWVCKQRPGLRWIVTLAGSQCTAPPGGTSIMCQFVGSVNSRQPPSYRGAFIKALRRTFRRILWWKMAEW